MRKQVLHITAFTLLFIMILSVGASAATIETAKPLTNDYIILNSASISAESGKVTVTFSITGTGTMTTIGASTIKIYTASGTLVKTYYSQYGYNLMKYSGSVTYIGTSGTKYYAVVKFYAANSSGSGTATYTTGTVTA